MLPGNLAGTYQQYKLDTATFITWLSNSVPEYKSQTNSKTAKKAARRKAAKATNAPLQHVTQMVTTRDLTDQAKSISGQVYLPGHIKNTLKRAIAARKRCAAWFQSLTGEQSKSTNDSHQYFIKVLEDVLKLLESDNGTKPDNNNDSYIGGRKPTHNKRCLHSENPPRSPSRTLGNLFQTLEIEDIAGGDFEPATQNETSPTPEIEIELEETSLETKLSLMIFCFFEDLHKIQIFLVDIWLKYKNLVLDLITASVVTEAAIDIVRRAEENIIAASPGRFSKTRSYDTIAIIVYCVDAFRSGHDPMRKLQSNDSLLPTEFNKFIYLSTARILMKHEYPETVRATLNYPLPSTPMKMFYVSSPEFLLRPEVQQMEQEDKILSQLINILHLHGQTYKYQSSEFKHDRPQPLADQLQKGLHSLLTNGVLTVSLVFHCRIFLDVHKLLGDSVGMGYKDLLGIVVRLEEDYRVEAPVGPTDDPNKVGELNEPLMCPWQYNGMFMRIYAAGSAWIKQSLLPKFHDICGKEIDKNGEKCKVIIQKMSHFDSSSTSNLGGSTSQSMVSNLSGDSSNPIFSITRLKMLDKTASLPTCAIPVSVPPPDDALFGYTHNPLLCGIVALEWITEYEDVALAVANYQAVIVLMAHLYTEAVRSEIINGKWPAMEAFIAIHRKQIFERFPQSAAEAYRCYADSLRPTAKMNFQTNDREYSYKEPSCNRSPLSDIFRPFVHGEEPFSGCMARLEAILHPQSDSSDFSPLELLAILRDKLPSELPKILFGYIPLVMVCLKLLSLVTLRINRDLGIQHEMSAMVPTSYQPAFPLMTLKILEDWKKMSSRARREKGKGKGKGKEKETEVLTPGSQLEIVGQVLAEHFRW